MTDHEMEAAVEAEFARFRATPTDVLPPAGPDAAFATARTRARRRRTATAVVAAVAVGAVLAAGTVAANNLAAPQPAPPAATPTGSPEPLPALPSSDPSYVWGHIPEAQPTGLKLLVRGWLLDIDARENHPVDVDGWLPRPGKDPLLVDVDWDQDRADDGPIEVSSRVEPALPGSPTVVRLNRPNFGTVAAADDGNGVWAIERESGQCTLREVDLDGQDRRPPRGFPCGLRLRTETAYGLWAVERAGTGDTVLLDPQNLAERARFANAELLDEDRILVYDLPFVDPEIRDLRTDEVVHIGYRPPPQDGLQFRIGPLSPDGVYLPHAIMDVPNQELYVDFVDLETESELGFGNSAEVTDMELAWAGDGRLVMFGTFPDTGYVITVGYDDGSEAVVPYELPEAELADPLSYEFLVLEP